jgi:tetratricopeptide (TPR) repeat protein
LREGGEELRCQERHLAHFLRFAEVDIDDQRAWLDRLEAEHDNFRAALAWASGLGGDVDAGLRLADALWRFWATRGYVAEGRDWLFTLLDTEPSRQSPSVRGNALHGAAEFERIRGDNEAARKVNEESLAIRQSQRDRRGVVASLNCLGLVDLEEGRLPAARARFEEALAIIRVLGESWGIANTLSFLGEVVRRQGDFTAARAHLEESLAIFRSVGDLIKVVGALDLLARLAHSEGDHSGARKLHVESLTIAQKLDDRIGIANSLMGLASTAMAVGRPGQAASILGGAARLWEEMSLGIDPSDRSVWDVRTTLGDDGAFDRAWEEGRTLTLEQVIKLALEATIERQ